MNGFRDRPKGRVARFKSAEIDPSRAMSLAADHAAVVERRTLFPTTVVASMDSPRLLVSGKNNPKLGDRVMKGPRTGWPIFQLTLEERATCPRSCAQWLGCYGNAMHMARRHRVDANFYDLLRAELTLLAREHSEGFMVRLHTLGDFPNTTYVRFWADMLDELPPLHVFGYTARSEDDDDLESRRTAKAIAWMANEAWDRFAIRFSRPSATPQGSTVTDRAIQSPQVIMCPAQTHDSEACATCGLCWSSTVRFKTIGFLRHGMKRSGGDEPKVEKRGRPPANRKSRHRKVLAVLRRAADPDGFVTMALGSIVREAGCSTAVLRSDIDQLKTDGLIKEEHAGRPHVPATYELDIAACDVFLGAAPAPHVEPGLDTPSWLVAARERLAVHDPIIKKESP